MVRVKWVLQSARMAFETLLSSLKQQVWSIEAVPAVRFRTLA